VVKGVALVLRVIAGAALCTMVLVTIADVIGRHLLGKSLGGVVEMVEFAQVWLVFPGIALAYAAGTHVTLDLIDAVLSARGLRWVAGAARAAAALIMAGMAWLAWLELLDKREMGDVTIDLKIPSTWEWAAVTLGFALAALLALRGTAATPSDGDDAKDAGR
jgi:TRAP-type C4-dicarboxylate transport system permease small subunit